MFHQNHETTLFCECYFLLVDKVALFHHNHETTTCCETYFLLVDKIWDKIILPEGSAVALEFMVSATFSKLMRRFSQKFQSDKRQKHLRNMNHKKFSNEETQCLKVSKTFSERCE